MNRNRTATIAKFVAVPLALVASGLVVAQASYSAYSDTTKNPVSSWASGTVKLTDDDARTAMFTAGNLKPGSTDSQCITVTSSGTLASTVKLYATDATATKNLDKQITLTISRGTGGAFGSCSGFVSSTSVFNGTLANFANNTTDYASGKGAWVTTGDETESSTYKIDYKVSDTAPNSSQGGTAGIAFVWEAQNN